MITILHCVFYTPLFDNRKNSYCEFPAFHVYYHYEKRGEARMKKKRVPIGYEDLKEVVEKNLYYVDKTMLLKDLMDSGGKVTLLTRPRRFGKTLNLSMIRRFFEDEIDWRGEPVDNGHIFADLAISKCGKEYTSRQGKYPVIDLSLKSAKQTSFELAYGELKKRISEEFKRHQYLLAKGSLTEKEKSNYWKIMNVEDEPQLYLDSIRFLSECLAKHHGRKTIILIDEYDVPLENSYFEGFYDQMIGFIRALFESALKTNGYLEFSVVTGCLRITRESIFTGLNNIEIHSVLSPYYSSAFGFTEEEVKTMLAYYDLLEKYEEVQAWYDGYLFGKQEIYNPWSIINYIKTAKADAEALPKAYWSNTSSNEIIRELIEEADDAMKVEIETLMEGGTIEKAVHEEITYGDIHQSADNLWNFLFFTGYLKAMRQRLEQGETYLTMAIPNMEIRTVYRRSILEWFEQRMENVDRTSLIKALEEGDCERAEAFISAQLMDTISYFDYGESYYHGFLAGLLKNAAQYMVVSNRECGEGRPDLILKTTAIRRGRVILLELKAAKNALEMEKKCREGMRQMEELRYAEPFVKEGYPKVDEYVICFYRKECMVMRG